MFLQNSVTSFFINQPKRYLYIDTLYIHSWLESSIKNTTVGGHYRGSTTLNLSMEVSRLEEKKKKLYFDPFIMVVNVNNPLNLFYDILFI